MVSVCPTGSVCVFTCLTFLHVVFHVTRRYHYFVPFLVLVVDFFFTFCLGGFYWFGGSETLSLYPNVPLFGFLLFREKLVALLVLMSIHVRFFFRRMA